MSKPQAAEAVKLDERHHVEKPLLEQLAGLGWEVIDLTDRKQTPADTQRQSFTEVVMLPVLRERLKVINPIFQRTCSWEVSHCEPLWKRGYARGCEQLDAFDEALA